jgi:hypothetical protein
MHDVRSLEKLTHFPFLSQTMAQQETPWRAAAMPPEQPFPFLFFSG